MAALIESGLEPEYFLDTVVKAETAGSGAVRVYFAAMKNGTPVLQFTVVASAADFVRMAKQVIDLAASQRGVFDHLLTELTAH